MDTTAWSGTDFGILCKVLLTFSLLLELFLASSIVLSTRLTFMVGQHVGDASLETTSCAGHGVLLITGFMDLTRATIGSETHDEVWKMAYFGCGFITSVSVALCQILGLAKW